MRKCAECGKETKKLKFNHVINRWYCKDCWIEIIGPKSASKAFEVTVNNPTTTIMERQEIKNILVPLDGSKNSLRGLKTAIYHAKIHRAIVTAIHVMHNIPKSRPDQKRTISQKRIESFMTLANKIAENNGVEFKRSVLDGDPKREIVNYCNSHDFDLIVMGARGLSLKKMLLGSVSNYVVKKSKMPVLVVK